MRQVAILVAASPSTAFFSQVAALSIALRALPWQDWTYRIDLYLGGPCDHAALHRWRPYLNGINLHWASADVVERDGDWAQSDDVFRHAPADADAYIAMDADTFPVASLESVLDDVLARNAIAGVIAHFPTAWPRQFKPNASTSMEGEVPTGARLSMADAWSEIARDLALAVPPLRYAHTLMPRSTPEASRATPFYLNFGVVFFAGPLFHAMTPRYLELRRRVAERLSDSDYSGQVALTFASATCGAVEWALPLRYNYPNDTAAEQLHPSELEHAVVFHYLRTKEFDRQRIFASADEYARFLFAPMDGVNGQFQRAVERRLGREYPFAKAGARRHM